MFAVFQCLNGYGREVLVGCCDDQYLRVRLNSILPTTGRFSSNWIGQLFGSGQVSVTAQAEFTLAGVFFAVG
jgi:hypothetical protein